MLDAAIRIAREKGFKKIILETISPLKIAIAMYKNAGFKEIKPIVNNKRVD
ncbi:MAG: GNAT family N-acetyltransferase, partial [Bacteroidetes bacterium]|nr:GNAT family N-acetyltransferase [Bacteroidota bacterium]